jgi:hypothetical protein
MMMKKKVQKKNVRKMRLNKMKEIRINGTIKKQCKNQNK